MLKFPSCMIFLKVCSLASRKVMGDTSVYILHKVLESWSSPETFRQCWKILTVAVSGFEGFFMFFPPSRTAFERHFCYANRFLPAAAELSAVAARKEPADTARRAGALFQAAHQTQQYCPSQPRWLKLALCSCSLAWWGCSWAFRWGCGDVLPFSVYQSWGFRSDRKWDPCADGSLSCLMQSCSDCVLCWQNHLQLRPNESFVLLGLVETKCE